ncbi:MAG: glycosyltransferase family 39 protein [Clostridium sp.]|jgi:4-amino-4-deoxy-L-arabinose transferase-like glycosyltransferase|uniref:glycosyltransferase family 39 protein n=1 Tax=Clostridium sp. TaxID=1506 RepID=UPI0025B8B68C|nr:glycosyltransferase family 39 protein [Clostridium sp.]MCH3965828.1 glycosyltransferase family 39 protein [Clostridium sp.]MCI1716083.1 glycosyltransferase family 39 protein [Clostridium sp.]MCI1800245.1 glycosyltransferase family 39 protein [Clostridium sp.]MCI1814260.1 glycosyltransferase family 39 protein [Clostridium sp.]MCI1871159.1 glycosyltransferase family 39 protein [Clostridium sp.]
MKKIKFTKEKIAITAILLLSAILNFANLSIENYGNEYYASGVKSMLMNFKNFFFVSFDPAGFVSIDKPPLGFWVQTISAKIFGFSGISIILPQALAGVISVGVLYYMVKRSFGTAAGIISALCLAVTPVFVAASRNNTVDNLLVMTLLFACMFLSKAAEKGKFKYLIISLVLVGIGFNIKMLEAYMVGPAIYITYLISSAAPVKKKILHLIAGTVVLAVVSLSWAFVVDMIPSQNRPFVGSSSNNTVMELIFGHNGLERLGSSNGGMGPGGTPGRNNGNSGNEKFRNFERPASNGNGTNSGNGSSQFSQNMQPPNGGQGFPGQSPDSYAKNGFQNRSFKGQGGPGGSSGLSGTFGGQTPAGITRLFSKNVLSDQIVWFIPLAILGFIASLMLEKFRLPLDSRKKLDLALWILWLLPEFIYFSYTTGLFHPYYLTMMAPPIAALSGIGITSMWKLYKNGGIKAWLLPLSFIMEGIVHLVMLSYFTSSISSTIRIIITAAVVMCFISSALLIILKLIKKEIFTEILTAVALAGILITPAIGSSAAINHAVSGTIPAAGLELLSSGNSQNPMMGRNGSGINSSKNSKLVKFLKSNASNVKYALVVSSSNTAQSIILESGQSVMALGGFSGSDKILTLSQFKELVKKGEVRYVLSGGGMGGRESNDIMSWVQKNGKKVDQSEWSETSEKNSQGNSSDNRMGMESQTLYDLKDTVQ